jgi:hypothetical protein
VLHEPRKALRFISPDPEQRVVENNPARTARDLEAMPFPID